MPLKVDLRDFLNEEGEPLELTEQAKTVFNFVIHIVSAVSSTVGLDSKAIDLKCNSRSNQVLCTGSIEAVCNKSDPIEWHCDTCEASGSISHWQASLWDNQARTLH